MKQKLFRRRAEFAADRLLGLPGALRGVLACLAVGRGRAGRYEDSIVKNETLKFG